MRHRILGRYWQTSDHALSISPGSANGRCGLAAPDAASYADSPVASGRSLGGPHSSQFTKLVFVPQPRIAASWNIAWNSVDSIRVTFSCTTCG
jgi:hypothetical protein